MNISKIITIANMKYIKEIDYIQKKKGRNTAENIISNVIEFNYSDNLDDDMQIFYEIFFGFLINNTKTIDRLTYVFYSSILAILCENNFNLNKLKESTFEQQEYIDKLKDNIEETMIVLNDKYKEDEYRKYKVRYYKKINKKTYSSITDKMLSKKDWHIQFIAAWLKEINYETYRDESYEFYLDRLNDKSYIFEVTYVELSIVMKFRTMLDKLIEHLRTNDAYEEYENILDDIIDDIARLSYDDKKKILQIHKNKIKNLYNDIKDTISQLQNSNQQNLNFEYPRRLSEKETQKLYIKEIEDLL